MEEFGSPRFEGIGSTIRRKRSQSSRRPRPESLLLPESRSPLSSTPPSDDVSKASSDENSSGDAIKRKEFNLNQCALRDGKAGDHSYNGARAANHGGNGLNQKRFSEGVLAPANWKSLSKTKGTRELDSRTAADGHGGSFQNLGHSRGDMDGIGNENKVKNVKLKVCGVTRTIQSKSISHGAPGTGSSSKSYRTSDAPKSRQKLILQAHSDGDQSPPPDKISGLQGNDWKNISKSSSGHGKEDYLNGKMSEKNASTDQGDKLEPIRKSKRVPKRRVLDGAFDEDDEDDEIRYLEKLKISKAPMGKKDVEEESSKKLQQISRVYKNGKHDIDLDDFGSSRSSKDVKKKSRSERGSEDTDYEEEDEELVSDCEAEGKKKKKLRKEPTDSMTESKREPALTTRQRALLSGKDASSVSGGSVVEFPNGLPPAPPRKQKEKLSEVEQQVKKAEAAQRRRMQVEKAARESEAEAIRKILGQDSSRKKREDKVKKRQEELAQEKAANTLMLASSTVRWVMGPNGTTVMFPKDMGLPSIFDPKPCSYPPPRETCAGPSCSNPYKYRDSKSRLPLCSLQCYKAIREKMQVAATC